MTENIHYVNNTPSDISMLFPFFKEAYKTGKLHEDGSARMVIEAA